MKTKLTEKIRRVVEDGRYGMLAAAVFLVTSFGEEKQAEAKTLKDIFAQVKTEVLTPFQDFFTYGGGLIGLVLIGTGLMRLYKRSQQGMQQQISVAEIASCLIVGACFLALAFVASTITESVTGQTTTGLGNF